jgi:hypothetical protein
LGEESVHCLDEVWDGGDFQGCGVGVLVLLDMVDSCQGEEVHLSEACARASKGAKVRQVQSRVCLPVGDLFVHEGMADHS